MLNILKTIQKLICNFWFLSILLIFSAIIVFCIPYYIIPNYVIPNHIEDEVTPQYDAVFQEVSENIEVTKERNNIYLNRVIEKINIDTKISEKEYQWMQKDDNNFSDIDETQVFFDKSKNYDARQSYDCETYMFEYASSELHQSWFTKYYIVDENGQNINGETFSFDKYLNEQVKSFTNDTINQKEVNLRTFYETTNVSLYILSLLLLALGIWLLIMCIVYLR